MVEQIVAGTSGMVRFLPTREYSALIRYGGSTTSVLTAAGLRYALGPALAGYPLLLFIPAVFASALLFDRAAGFFATNLSGLFALLFIGSSAGWVIGSNHVLALALYGIICFAISVVIGDLKVALAGVRHAERSKSVLLEELAHRTKNDFAIISSAITLQANAAPDLTVKAALNDANSRVMIVASAQERLQGADAGGRVELQGYIEGLCAGSANLLRGIRPVAIRVQCDVAEVPTSTAVTVGLVVNELVTNCFKYAFPGEQEGRIDVTITVQGRRVLVVVEDNGVGCPADAKTGLGSRLVRMLAQQKKGTVTREKNGDIGCRVIVDLVETSAGSAV